MNELEQARIKRVEEENRKRDEERDYVMNHYDPVHSNLLVEMSDDLKTDLELPEDVAHRSSVGSVMATVLKVGPSVGQGSKFTWTYGGDMRIRHGDKVILKRFGATPIPGVKGRYQFLADDQIIGIYTGDK